MEDTLFSELFAYNYEKAKEPYFFFIPLLFYCGSMSSLVAEKQAFIPTLQDCIPQLPVAGKPAAAAPAAAAPMARAIADKLIPTIFHEAWWLDIVTGGNYSVVEVTDRGQVVGRWYSFLRNRGGLKYSIMPPMTHFLGPVLIDDGGSAMTRFLRRAKITHELIHKLPPASIYQYKCHRDIVDAIAFQQENFYTSVQFTYEMFPDDEKVLWKNMRGEKRKKIQSAQKSVTVSSLCDPMEFWRFYDENLRSKRIRNVCDRTICCKLIEACISRGHGRIYAAHDQNKKLVAAVFCVWDNTSSFYFMSSRADGAHNGAISLLAWEAMKEAAQRGLIFDFDGLNNSKAVLFFTEFGGIISPRFIVTRHTPVGGMALSLKNMYRASKYFY